MRVGFSTKVLLTAFLPVVLLLAATFVALRILVDSSVRDNVRMTAQRSLNMAASARNSRDALERRALHRAFRRAVSTPQLLVESLS